ncbi:hypothetical protein NY08_1210 [Rhodococcus sp. B7740]|nr:hypothetical protein NY08_1210 [Rhodococcus sp. B7740]
MDDIPAIFVHNFELDRWNIGQFAAFGEPFSTRRECRVDFAPIASVRGR